MPNYYEGVLGNDCLFNCNSNSSYQRSKYFIFYTNTEADVSEVIGNVGAICPVKSPTKQYSPK